MKNSTEKAIPVDAAQRICSEIRRDNGVKLFSQCWGCVKFSKSDPSKMCFASKPDNRGCSLVNKHYDKQQPPLRKIL